MSPIVICIALFVVMLVLFFTNKIPMSFTALAAMVALVLFGCLDSSAAIATFGSNTVITMASMFVVAAGLTRTQMINNVTRLLYKVTEGSFTKVLASYVVITCIIGQFVPSIVAIFALVQPAGPEHVRQNEHQSLQNDVPHCHRGRFHQLHHRAHRPLWPPGM